MSFTLQLKPCRGVRMVWQLSVETIDVRRNQVYRYSGLICLQFLCKSFQSRIILHFGDNPVVWLFDCKLVNIFNIEYAYWGFSAISGIDDDRRLVVRHGGCWWQVCACSTRADPQLLFCFPSGHKVKPLLTCMHSLLIYGQNIGPLLLYMDLALIALRTCELLWWLIWDLGANVGLQDLSKRIIPLCENYMVVSQFAEARSHFKHGLTNHAFTAGLRAILQVGISSTFCFNCSHRHVRNWR